MLSETQIEESKSLIETSLRGLDELSLDFDKARKEIEELEQKIKLNSIEDEKHTSRIRLLNMHCDEMRKDHTPLLRLIETHKQTLATDEFDKKVNQAVEQATPFYIALETRLNRLQAEYKETMSDLFHFVEPAVVIGFVQKRIEGVNDFSQITLNYRTAKNNYENRLLELGTAKVKGETPSFEQAKQQLRRLDLFLESEDVIQLWHRPL